MDRKTIKICLSWLIGALISIILMLLFMKLTKINIPNWLGFFIMVLFVTVIQKSIKEK